MNTIANYTSEKEVFYQNCINEFGSIEDAMKDIAHRTTATKILCTEYLCGTLACSNTLICD